MSQAPPVEVLASILGPQTTATRHVDIYESDGETPFFMNAPLVDGVVNIDQGSSERRSLDLTLDNSEMVFEHAPGGFWYDKILRPYRGAIAYNPTTAEPTQWEAPLGEFYIDSIESQHFPNSFSVQCRDKTKKLIQSKFRYATSFNEGESVIDVVKSIAQNGGIEKFNFPSHIGELPDEYTFEADTERWDAITDITTAFNHEAFFDADGYMVVRPFQDPLTSPVTFSFETGAFGTIASWKKSSNDTRLHNVIIVKGESSDTVPHTAIAQNVSPGSPTSIDAIGERVFTYSSPYITSENQAQDLANSMLKVHALEEYSIDFESIVLPWLEVGEVIRFPDDENDPDAPTLFLLSSLAIPLTLGPMSSTGKRVTVVS